MKNIPQMAIGIQLILTSLLPAVAIAVEQADKTESTGRTAYFAQMPFRESPFADLRGIYPISRQKSDTYNHFRFEFDSQDRPVEISFRLGDRIRNLNLAANVLTFAPVTRIEYDNGRETRTFHDAHMNRMTVNGSVYTEVFEYDADGNRKSLEFLGIDGEAVESDWGIARYSWRISKDGTVTENRFNLQNEPIEIRPGFPFFCLKLHYDQNGWLTLMENYGKDCDTLTTNELNAAQDKLQYTASGDMYAWNVYDASDQRSVGNGPRVARGVRGFDSLGQEIIEFYEDEFGNLMTNAYGWTHAKTEFDLNGNMIGRLNYGLEGKPALNEQLGFAGYRMQFDETGMNRLLLNYVDAQGNPAVHRVRGYYLVRTHYDDSGNPILTRFEGIDGEIVNRLDNGVGIIERHYDGLGRLNRVELFNKDHQPVRHRTEDWHRTSYLYRGDGPLIEVHKN